MALITCPECGRQISDKAAVCIGCGIPMEEIRKMLKEAEAAEEIIEELPAVETAEEPPLVIEADLSKRTIRCSVCDNEFALSDRSCPICKYPALCLSGIPDVQEGLIEQYRIESGFGGVQVSIPELSKALLNRAYTTEELQALNLLLPDETRKKLIPEYRDLADRWDKYALCNLGLLYMYGVGVEKDEEIAADYFKKAAECGVAEAQSYHGWNLVYAGQTKEGVVLIRKAAERNSASAQYILSLMYLGEIDGTETNTDKGIDLLRKASEHGDYTASSKLGDLYFEGEKAEQDYSKAAEYYWKAIEQGNIDASEKLGLIYAEAPHVILPAEIPENSEVPDYRKPVLNRPYYYHEIFDMTLEETVNEKVEAELAGVYRKLADQGDPIAQNNLGLFYAFAAGVQQDDEIAHELLKKAAESGDLVIQTNFGMIHDPEVDDTGLKIVQDAAYKNCSYAQYALGVFYEDGDYAEQNYQKAKYWYAKAAMQGYAPAAKALADVFMEGKGVDQDLYAAIAWNCKAASLGDCEAAYHIGNVYKDGEDVEQDIVTAAKWYNYAAKDRWGSDAVEDLTELYLSTLTNKRLPDISEYITNANVQYEIGDTFDLGIDIEEDSAKAAEWFIKAANQGHPNAEIALGISYRYGTGVNQDYKEAAKMFQRAVDHGDSFGYSGLGDLYRDGLGVEQDYAKAAECYESAGETCYRELGKLYEKGLGVKKDPDKAKELYEKARDYQERTNRAADGPDEEPEKEEKHEKGFFSKLFG